MKILAILQLKFTFFLFQSKNKSTVNFLYD